MGPKVCESKAAPFGSIHWVHFPVGTFGPPPLPADLACFALWEFFTDLDFIVLFPFQIKMRPPFGDCGIIYKIAVGTQDCVLRPEGGI
jgi:hypothetical protein